MIEDKRLTDTELEAITDRITGDWVSRAAVDFADAVAFHESLPPHKRFAAVLENAEAVLCQPRAGVPRLDEHVELLQHLDEEGGADLLPTTIDSYTRDNAYEKAAEGLARSREADSSELNGFPAVNHGVEGCREVVRRVDAPVQVRHGTPDARLLAAVTLAGGFQSFEGGPITYNLPYTSAYDLETTIEYWQYVDRLCGAYTERGVTINREPFGPLTGTLVPPSIAIAIVTIEGLLAATQGVRSVTLGYGQVGNLVQDVAAVRAMAAIGAEYLPDSVTVTTVLHQWMGVPARRGAGPRRHRAGRRDRCARRTHEGHHQIPQEAVGVPTAESNAAGLRTTEQVLRMLDEQSITLDGVDREQALIERSVRSLLDAVYEAGDGDIARGTVRAFDAGTLDIPFPPSDAAAGDVLPARDDDGRVRLLKFGAVALDDETKRIHRARLDRRADTEGRELSFRMVADDVSAVSDGRLIGRPGDD